MDAYKYLEVVAAKAPDLNDREEIVRVLDELEFLYEALDPEFQNLAGELIAELSRRMDSLGQT